MTFYSFPQKTGCDGNARRAGFEFEMAVIKPEVCASLIADIFGGTISARHSLEYTIQDTSIGDFTVELDAKPVKDLVAQLENRDDTRDDLLDFSSLKRQVSEWIGQAAGILVPVEVVTPPMHMEQFDTLVTLLEQLRKHEAVGTRARVTNAFGMHINIEIASEDVGYICSILRAFLLLYPWLKKVMKVDISRRFLTYIDPFPKDYTRLILREDYSPDLETFRDDYIQYNPTRSRALDLLPLLSHLLPDTIHKMPKDMQALIKSRPAFHYRLPNCEIDNADWHISRDWNYWIEVETLAADAQRLRDMADRFLKADKDQFYLSEADWVQILIYEFDYGAA